ncbi:hypothetical protein ABZY57_04335 [Streptomyces sp. NPDC006450]|uniref:DUF6881 domain-containing protein n=1 Tax=Streptomyces sp. NPDC006450 TaxID=3155458 RepID=UPI00339E149E
MRYIKVSWEHNFPDEPILCLSEIGDDDYETRKVNVYSDGRSEWADDGHETPSIGLSEIPFPELGEISRQPEFLAEEISAAEFDQAWRSSH